MSFSGMMEDVLREAFLKTDEEFSNSGLQAGLVGSTAVVALVGTHRVWIANCGEQRGEGAGSQPLLQGRTSYWPEQDA
jgi:protein phosphatase 2C